MVGKHRRRLERSWGCYGSSVLNALSKIVKVVRAFNGVKPANKGLRLIIRIRGSIF